MLLPEIIAAINTEKLTNKETTTNKEC